MSFVAGASGDVRKMVFVPRSKGRENARNILCRNLTLSGTCRAPACPYNHDTTRFDSAGDSTKRFLNVESPAFTPVSAAGQTSTINKPPGISPKAAAAAVFTPKSSNPKPAQTPAHDIPEFVPKKFTEFTPRAASQTYDPFTGAAADTQVDQQDQSHAQINPYSQDNTSSLYTNANTAYNHPLNYHLYAPIGPYRDNLLPYQRTIHDLFISDHLREELQRKADAVLQTYANSALPQQIDHFHSLVLLETNVNTTRSASGYVSRLYKAVSSKDGYTYCLRRLENFRLTDEKAVASIQTWKRIDNASTVIVHDAFTTRAFGDSSLIVVTDYHPLSQTLAERHTLQPLRNNSSRTSAHLPTQELWSYVIQLTSAIKAIHSNGLAARLVSPTKILVTSKSRVRLNTCGVLDIAHYDSKQSIADMQAQDIVQLGQTILCLATKNASAHLEVPKATEQVNLVYGEKMASAISWLLTPPADARRDIDDFLALISTQVLTAFDASLHEADSLTSTLSRELENARLVRLLSKLNIILERPDTNTSSSTSTSTNNSWSETGERYHLKLFRDYVFHQVDSENRPSLDLGHILACLNRLDSGVDEKISLVSRDEQNCFIVSYKELKRGFESAWNELLKASSGSRRL